METSSGNMERLINAVRQHTVLYDTNNNFYRDANMRNEAWEDIGLSLKTPAARCKETWAKLRNSFSSALKRRQKKNGQTLVPWKYENQMAFILPFMSGGRIYDNLEDDDENSSDVNSILNLNEDPEEVSEIVTDIITNELKLAKSQVSSPPQKKRKESEEYVKEVLDNFCPNIEIKRDIYIQRQMQNLLRENDDVDLFYLSMARIIKTLPKIDQARLRIDFCRMVSEAEIRNMETPSTPSSTTFQSISSCDGNHPDTKIEN